MSDIEAKLRSANPAHTPSAVAVGTFDGVHKGHQKLLGALRDNAKSRSLRAIAVAFRQQPRSFIRPDVPFSYLCELDERLALLRALGLDAVCDVDFDGSVRVLTAHEFLYALRSALNMRLLVLGPGAKQGHDQVDAAGLRGLGATLGFEVVVVGSALTAGAHTSSTAIRTALALGGVDEAAAMLGRHFSLTGTVQSGDRRGREIGFPTANLGPFANATVPMNGIYATWAHLGGEKHMAATSIGVRPTFGAGNERRVEAYILDFNRDVYGQKLKLEFVERLRGEVAYTGVGPLVEQIKKDVEQTRSVLNSDRGTPSPGGRGSG